MAPNDDEVIGASGMLCSGAGAPRRGGIPLLSEDIPLPEVDVGAGNAKVKSEELDDIALVDRSRCKASHKH